MLNFQVNYFDDLCHRSTDCELIANYRVQAELSAVDSTYDGRGIVLGTVDGCVSVLAIADPQKPEMNDYLKNLPSRDEQVMKKTNSKYRTCKSHTNRKGS